MGTLTRLPQSPAADNRPANGELKIPDGNMIAIDTIAVENKVADKMYQRQEDNGSLT